MKGVILVFLLFVSFAFCNIEFSATDSILNSCKYVKCKNVVDLNKEARIRRCIKTTCNSRAFKTANLKKYCQSSCIEESQDLTEEQLRKQKGELPTILDYSWLE